MWIIEIFKKKPVKLRIVHRTYPDGRQKYVIQKKEYGSLNMHGEMLHIIVLILFQKMNLLH